MALNDYDKFLVNNGTATETISLSLLKDDRSINDSDLFLINDGTETETATWGEIQNSRNPIITAVILTSDDSEVSRFTNESFTTTVVMQNDGTKSIRGKVNGTLSQLVETDEIIRVLEITPEDSANNKGAVINLYFSSAKDFDLLSVGDFIQQSDGATSGEILGIYPDEFADPILQIEDKSANGAQWGPANTGLYVVAQVTVEGVTKYLNLDSDLNVTGLSQSQTDFTLIPNNTFTAQLKFGLTLGTGDAPDDVLLDGTTIQTEILATKGAETDSLESNIITPTPCVPGDINTDEIINVSADGLTLTFDGTKSLAKIVPDQIIFQSNATEVDTLIGYTIRNSKSFQDTWDNVGPDIEEVVAGQLPSYVGSNQYNYFKLGISAKVIIAKDLDREPSTPSLKLWGSNDAGSTWDLACSDIPVGNPGESNIVSDKEYRYYMSSNGNNGTQSNPHLFFIDNTAIPVLQPQGLVGSIRYIGDSFGSTVNEITLNTTLGTWGPASSGHSAVAYYECPSVFTPLYLQNSEDVIKFNTIKTALDGYEEDLHQYHVDLTQSLYTAGFNTAELSTMNLPN